jgi:hypothetical protein
MKKKSFIIFLILAISLNTYAQKIKNLPVLNHFSLNTDTSFVEGYLAPQKKEINADDQKMYTWFAGGKINHTQGDYKDRLLDGVYTSSYSNKQLKEKGEYNNGLKKADWLSWDEDGKLQRKNHFHKGWLKGYQITYDLLGIAKKRVHYRNNKMNGNLQEYQKGNWVTTAKYSNGEQVPIKAPFYKRFFKAIFKKHPQKDEN